MRKRVGSKEGARTKSEASREDEIDFWWFWRHDQELEGRHTSAWREFFRNCYYISHLLLFSFFPLLISWCTHRRPHIIYHISSCWSIFGYGFDVASLFYLFIHFEHKFRIEYECRSMFDIWCFVIFNIMVILP